MHVVHWHITGQERTRVSKVYMPTGTTARTLREMIAGVESGDTSNWMCVKIDAIYDREGMITGLPIVAGDEPAQVARQDRDYWTDRYDTDREDVNDHDAE